MIIDCRLHVTCHRASTASASRQSNDPSTPAATSYSHVRRRRGRAAVAVAVRVCPRGARAGPMRHDHCGALGRGARAG
eukprot:CAMPEP_0206012696 /NCGR_PEP_ID=MMETSP1464-20131121/15276_1 /ASSEMBLY_ACC=CAM_ASM_001124 /TAXON_ID=119497 /ORGANISM="Exanthemachrysis gayraliae, Strain RCC1523" /LENGTH=77 /DNA_ID=CAMNT_0053386387 /DNA_START=127 /DNA_END=356 /DNA_ORIENTATION=+